MVHSLIQSDHSVVKIELTLPPGLLALLVALHLDSGAIWHKW